MHASEYIAEVIDLKEIEIEVISTQRENLSISPNVKKYCRIEVTGTVSTPGQRGRNWSEQDSLLLVETYT